MSARRVLLVATTLALIAAGVAGYARTELVAQEHFVARAVSTLDDEEVRTAVATRVVDRLARSVSPEVLVVRPLLLVALGRLADTAAFRRAVAVAAADVHGQLLDGASSYVVSLGPSSPVVGDALRSVAPRLARALPDDLRVEVVEVAPGDAVLRGTRAVADLARWWWPLLIAALAAAVGLAWVARSVREAAALLGTAVLAAGLTVAASVTVVGLAIARTDDPVRRGARSALWTAVAGDLRTTALLLALAGAVSIAAAVGAGAPDPLQRVANALRPLARAPGTGPRVARALAAGALGVGLIVVPGLVASVAAVVGGALLVALAASRLWPASAPETAGVRRSPASARGLALALVAPVAAAVVALLVVLPAPATVPVERLAPASACNGTVALCGRRLNDVAFPGTHNSYSAADEPGWLFANQRRGIARQLQDGIRALLVDVHYGVADPASGRVRTDLRAEGSSRSKVARELSPEALVVADRLGARVGAPLTGERRAYMCHTLCELGAEPLAEQFRIVREFLDGAPRETVVMFVESYVDVAEIEEALAEAGLLAQAARLSRDEPLPTLGELVAADTRLVVLAEEEGGARPWFLPGFSFAQDTPLGARAARELRCSRFRGDADSPLLLLNHWIDTFPPSPTRNQRIGGRVLRDRAERCARERALVPNLLAVDFYERSDVLAVAAERNR